MAVCKECGALNPDSNKFCSECGQPIVKLDSKAIRDAMSQMEAEFEQDALVSLDRSRLTYICDVCGKVNPIDAKQCVRCGKKRPRSEYINALTKIKNSRKLKTAVESLTVQKPEPQKELIPTEKAEELPAQPPAPILPKEEIREEPKERQEFHLYRLDADVAPSQNRQIVQPFVIVPYVSQNQPLLQYDPHEIYRYVPYSDAEKRRQAELLQRREAEETERRAAEEERNRALKKAETEKILARKVKEKKRAGKVKKPSSAKVTVTSFFALLIAVAGVVAAFMDLIVKDFTMFRFMKGDSIVGIGTGVFVEPTFDSQFEILAFVYGLLVILFLIVLALILIQNLIRVFTGRIYKRGFLNLALPIVALIFAIGLTVVNLANNNWAFGILVEGVYGWAVALAVSIVTLTLYIVAGARPKRPRFKNK